MSDNSEQTQSQTEVTSSEQMVGLVPMQSEANSIGVQLIGADNEDDIFFGSQAIELNGERHVIVSQAQDPETGELLIVLRGENGDHIAIQSEALSSMVQASGGEGIQVAVVSQSDETGLTIAADLSSLTQSVSDTDVNTLTTSISILPSIIANIPSQTQTATAPTNVVQSIDTPRVSQEEQPSTLSSITPTIPTKESVAEKSSELTTELSAELTKELSTELTTELSKELTKELSTELPTKLTALTTSDETSGKKESEVVKNVTEAEDKLEPMDIKSETKETDNKPQEVEDISEQKSEIKDKQISELKQIETPVSSESDIKPIETEKMVETNAISEKTTISESIALPSDKLEETTPNVTTSSSTTLTSTTTSEPITTTTPMDTTPDVGFGNTAVIQVQDSGSGTSLEQLMANAMLSSDGNYVFMAQTEDGHVTSLSSELNLSDVISAGTAAGQAFFIETPEGLVACTASATNEDGAIQLIPTDAADIESAVISSAQTSSNSVENQIIQAISGAQAMAYTFTSNSGCLELTPVSTPQTQTPSSKPVRGRGGRTPKSRTITPISSMGQTLLLSTESTSVDTPVAKPITQIASTRGRGRGRGGRGGVTHNSNANSITNISTTLSSQQLKTNTKAVVPPEPTKSSTGIINSLSTDTTVPGPSQLAASRRTYSKKSNIVWITPDPSQSAANTAFATVATTPATIPTTAKTNLSQKQSNNTLSNKTQATNQVRVRTPSPTKITVSTTPQTNTSITLSKAITASKPITSTTNANKNAPQSASVTKTVTPLTVTTGSKSTVATTSTKTITASKTSAPITTAVKTTVQSNTNRVQTQNISIKNNQTISKTTENVTKTTIRVSDITATKTSVSTPIPKTSALTTTANKSVTVASVTKPKPSTISTKTVTSATNVSKAIPTTISSTKPITSTTTSAKGITSIPNKPVISTPSTNKPVMTTTPSVKPVVSSTSALKSTVSTLTTTPITTSITSSKTVNTSIASPEKALERIGQTTTAVTKPVNTVTKSPVSAPVVAKEVKPTVSTPMAIISNVASSETESNSSKEKTVEKIVSTQKEILNSSPETRLSSRLSPTKSTKKDVNISSSSSSNTNSESNQQIATKQKSRQISGDSDKSKAVNTVNTLAKSNEEKSAKSLDTKDDRNTTGSLDVEKPSVSTAKESKDKTEDVVLISSVGTTLSDKSSDKTEKKSENESEKQTESEVKTKSVRSTRRNSRNTTNATNIDENKIEIEKKVVNESKLIETKSKEIIAEKSKEKTTETPIVPEMQVNTRRTSRKRDVSALTPGNTSTTKNDSPSIQTTFATTVSTPVPLTSGRVTRASSGKKTENKPKIDEKDSKIINKSNKELSKSETESKEPKLSNDLDRVKTDESKTQSTPQSSKKVMTNITESITVTRSVKKRVQFELKDNKEDEIVIKKDEKLTKTDEKVAKINEKTTKNDEKILKSDEKEVKPIGKGIKTDRKLVKADEGIVKIDDKVVKADEKVTKSEEKVTKPEEKSVKSDDKVVKSDDKVVKSDEKVVKLDEKVVKSDEKVVKSTEKVVKSAEKVVKSAEKVVKSAEKVVKSADKGAKTDEKIVKTDEKVVKSDEKVVKTSEKTKTPEISLTISTRRSLRSTGTTPQVEIKAKTDNEIIDNNSLTQTDNNITNNNNKTPVTVTSSKTPVTVTSSKTPVTVTSSKTPVTSSKTPVTVTSSKTPVTSSKTPQRFSTRKRKEVPKSATPEPEVRPTKISKKGLKVSTTPIETNVSEKSINSLTESKTDIVSIARLRRDRKSRTVKKIETRAPVKENIRQSIETSESVLGRHNRKKSLIQSYIDEKDSQEKEEHLRKKTISSLSDLRSPNECYNYSTNECSFYIRHQSVSLTPKQSGGNYLCQKCGFHTTRINNLVIHHRDQCSYIKNAVIQQWQSELQKRVKPIESSDVPTSSRPKAKRRKIENSSENVDTKSLDKKFDETDDESDEELNDSKTKTNEKSDQNPTISDIDAMLMGSDDEDLLSIDNIENPKRELGFSEEDIVWVDTNNTHWPALVSKVYTKDKKVLIKLIDGPWSKKCLKTNVSSILLFDSAEVNKRYLREGRKTSNGDLLVKAVQKAEEFLRKKCLGNEMSAAKFFDQIDSDLSENCAEEDDKQTTNEDNSTKDIETPQVANEALPQMNSSSIETNVCDNEDDRLSENNEAVAQWKEKRRQQNAKLLQCIKDGKVETHLLGVYRESILSERHQKFKSGSESEKNQLKHVPWFGPIDDEEQQEEIYDYCSQLFKSNFKTDGSFDTVAYIFEVWVPEAIVKAISRVRRIELKDSESIFAKGVILSKSEKDELTKEIQKEAEKQLISHTSSD